MLAILGDALDLVDFGIVLLDRDMRALFVNRRFGEIWAVPQDELRALVEQLEGEVPAGTPASTEIDLGDGRRLLLCCYAGTDGGRVLTCTDITSLKVQEEQQREARDAAERMEAELRFNKETLEDQACYLASLAEDSDANARRAEDANKRLEREIAERRQLEAELRRLATTDTLTGTLNRRQFFSLATRELVRVRELEKGLAGLMVDIDHFKAINDRHGHAVGDKALKHVVGRLRAGIRRVDLIGRLGGEEFAIILPEIAGEAALQVAERLRGSVEAKPLLHDGMPICMTVSIGLSMARDTDRGIEQIIARADGRLYRAKEGGRNRVCHDQGTDMSSARRPAVPATRFLKFSAA